MLTIHIAHKRLTRGLYTKSGSQLYVNCGIGTHHHSYPRWGTSRNYTLLTGARGLRSGCVGDGITSGGLVTRQEPDAVAPLNWERRSSIISLNAPRTSIRVARLG